MERTLDKFIDKLLKEKSCVDTRAMIDAANAFYGDTTTDHEIRTHLLSREDYERILKPAWELIQRYHDATPEEIREVLFKHSGIRNLVNTFVFAERNTPGMVLSYGIGNLRETYVCGNKNDSELSDTGLVTLAFTADPMEEDTIFDIASNTKMFTATAILKLFSDGTIKLSDRVTKLDPRFINLKDVTIEQLLSFNVPLRTPGNKRINTAKDREEAEKLLFATEIDTDAKEFDRKYNDLHAMILKYVVESVTQENLIDYIKETIIEPLGMTDTDVVVPEHKLDRVSSTDLCFNLFISDEDNTKETLVRTPLGEVYDPKARMMGQKDGILSGHAGMFSTIPDLAKLAKAMTVKDMILSPKAIRCLYTNHTGRPYINEKGDLSYTQYHGAGLNFLTNPDRGSSEVPHTFSGKSFASNGWTGTYVGVDPVNDFHIEIGGNKAHGRLAGVSMAHKGLEIPSFKKDNGWIQREPFREENRFVQYRTDAGISVPMSYRYAWNRDKIVDATSNLLLQYRMLEYMMPDVSYEKDEHVLRKGI